MGKPVTLPTTGSFTLSHVRLHQSTTSATDLTFDGDGLALADIVVKDGIIAAIGPSRGDGAAEAVDGQGGIVLPAFVDCHTHLDKGHIWARKPNPDGSFMAALTAVGEDRTARWTANDVARRMDFSLRTAHAHGTRAIRTHLDSVRPQEDISWAVFRDMRAAWKGRIDLQAACLFAIDDARNEAWFDRLAGIVSAAGGVLGAVTFTVPDLDALLDRIFQKAMDLGLDLDFHADETDDVEAVSLSRIAHAALRHGYEGRILVGHCCSLARQPDAAVLGTLDLVAKSGLSVVSLPMCNMYLQDRRANSTTPRWRGVTLLHELADRGVNVCVASDNTRDPFYAYGDMDVLEVYREATRILQLDHPVGNWPRVVGANPASAMGLSDAGTLATGARADFIVFRGRRFTELLSRPESDRIVVRDGQPLNAAIPRYAELDDLMEP